MESLELSAIGQRTEPVRALAFEIADLTSSPRGFPDAEDWVIAELLCTPIGAKDPELQARTARARKTTLVDDLSECALIAGFVIAVAGAMMPELASIFSTVFSKVSAVLVAAG